MAGLILAIVALVSAGHAAAEPIRAIDTGSGLAVVFPKAPMHASSSYDHIVMSRYMAQGPDFGFVFSVFRLPNEDRYLGTRGLDYLDQHVSQFIPGDITQRGPAMFGPSRGFFYLGRFAMENEEDQFSARFFQIGTCWVLMEAVGKSDPEQSPDVAAFYRSLQLCVDGQPPVGSLRDNEVTAKMHASIDADLVEDTSIDSSEADGNDYAFIQTNDEEQILFRSLEFDDSRREEFLSQSTLNKAQVRIEDYLKMTETKDRSFSIGPYNGKEFEMENDEYHAKARLFGFGNRRYLVVYESRGPLDVEKADHCLNSFQIDFSKRES